MSAAATPGTQPEGRLHCPKCGWHFDPRGDEARVSFTPVSATLLPDGTFDFGTTNDAFLDYWHMPCGTRVRMVSNARWQEELGEYVTDSDPWIEINIDGEYVTPAETSDLTAFSTQLSENPTKWGPTYLTLLALMAQALENLHKEEVR